MRVLIAGSQGFLGRHLASELTADGHRVVALLRHAEPGTQGHLWAPGAPLDVHTLDGIDVVVNLAGAPLLGNPHSSRWARNVRGSRVDGTRTLAEAVAAHPARPTLIAASGISWYGDHASQEVTERSESRGDSLLTSITRDWEAATDPATSAGARVCVLRSGLVLHRTSSPLKQQRRLYRFGLGARIGSGSQYLPVISLSDWVNATRFLMASGDLHGPFNLCCPQTPTNAEFAAQLGSRWHRRPLALPVTVARVAAGPVAGDLLGSVNARPEALLKAGFDFADTDLDSVLTRALA